MFICVNFTDTFIILQAQAGVTTHDEGLCYCAMLRCNRMTWQHPCAAGETVSSVNSGYKS